MRDQGESLERALPGRCICRTFRSSRGSHSRVRCGASTRGCSAVRAASLPRLNHRVVGRGADGSGRVRDSRGAKPWAEAPGTCIDRGRCVSQRAGGWSSLLDASVVSVVHNSFGPSAIEVAVHELDGCLPVDEIRLGRVVEVIRSHASRGPVGEGRAGRPTFGFFRPFPQRRIERERGTSEWVFRAGSSHTWRCYHSRSPASHSRDGRKISVHRCSCSPVAAEGRRADRTIAGRRSDRAVRGVTAL